MSQSGSIEIHILGRAYRVASTEEQELAIRAAARLLDSKMREIRDAGKVVGIERIAIMAGLNLAHEALKQGGGVAAADALQRCHELVDGLLLDLPAGH